jgi:hypothetical protein
MPLSVRVRVEVPTTTEGSAIRVTSLAVRVPALAEVIAKAESSPTRAIMTESFRVTGCSPNSWTGQKAAVSVESVAPAN